MLHYNFSHLKSWEVGSQLVFLYRTVQELITEIKGADCNNLLIKFYIWRRNGKYLNNIYTFIFI